MIKTAPTLFFMLALAGCLADTKPQTSELEMARPPASPEVAQSSPNAWPPTPEARDASGFGLRRNLLWLPVAVPVGESPVDTGPAGT